MNEVDIIHDSFDLSRDRWNSAIVNFNYKRDNSILGLDSAWGKVDLRSKAARISMITVKPEYRGKGVGKRVMVIIESLVKSLGARTIRGSAMEGSEAFWAKLGYGVIPKTRRHKFEEWRPSIIKRLPNPIPSIISDTFRRAKAGGSLNPKLKMVPSMMGSYWAPFKGEIVIGKADPEVVEHMPEVLGHEIGHSKLHTKGYYMVRFPAGKSLTALEKLKHELEAWDWALMKSRAVGYSRKFILDCLRSYLPGYARQRREGEFLINQMLAKHFPEGNRK